MMNYYADRRVSLRKYIYNSRDVAAYFKYFSVPSYLEVSYMQYIFNIGNKVLAEPLTRDFDSFKTDVYRELYFLWANGFENERADISKMTSDGQLSLICDQECICLESYMKLICLHLIFSGSLPYINLNFTGLMTQLGIKCGIEQYEENCKRICDSLQLEVFDTFGKPFDLSIGIPDELLRVRLSSDFKSGLDCRNFKETLRSEQMNWLKDLKDKSFKLFGSRPARKKTAKSTASVSLGNNRNHREPAYPAVENKVQPKGSPKSGR